MIVTNSMQGEKVFHYSISARPGRSDRSKGELPLSGFVGIEYLLRSPGSSKGQIPE